MKNKIKITLAACIGCILLMGGVVTVLAAGTLTIAVSSGTVAAGDTTTVTVYAAGANNEEVTSEMTITYDSSKLEYVSSTGTNASGGGGTVKVTGTTVNVKFKAIASGDAYVKAEGATLTAAGAHITVSGSATADQSKTETTTDNGTLSGDNSLSSLKISPGTLSPEFKGSTTSYTATVGSDVNEITVTPVTSNSKATVESITGNKDLREGENTVTVLVKAENGTQATYKIVVTKGGGTVSAGDTDSVEPLDSDTGNTDMETNPTTTPAGDAIVIQGVTYKISEEFSDEDIPEGFSRANFEYKGDPYKGVSFDYGHLGMYYLINEAGEGKFFVYDADRDGFYPYVRLSSGEHFIILMVVPNGAIPPDDYEETTLLIGETTEVQAYQYAGVKNADMEESDSSDFYIFYAMDGTGVPGWYQYDITQGTYQRLNEEAVKSSDNEEAYNTLQKSYNELNDRYKSTKRKDRRLIAILIFVTVVLIIVIINLILKNRDDDEEEEDFVQERRPRVSRESKSSRQQRASREQRTSKEQKTSREQRMSREERISGTEPSFYEEDDADIMGEFEEEPRMLSGRQKKNERISKESTPEPTVPKTVSEEDDDIEFLDLNDL